MRNVRSSAPSFPLTVASLRDALLGRKAKASRQSQVAALPQFGILTRRRWSAEAAARLIHLLIAQEVKRGLSFSLSFSLFLSQSRLAQPFRLDGVPRLAGPQRALRGLSKSARRLHCVRRDRRQGGLCADASLLHHLRPATHLRLGQASSGR